MKLGPLEIRFTGAKSGLANPSQWLQDFLGAGKSSTGLDINETTAMQVVAVYACVKVLAETMSSLPLPVYRVLKGGGKVRAEEHPLYTILHDAPNPEMTSLDFRATMMTHLMLWGNAYAEIERDQAGRPIALWPLRPDRMQIWRSTADTNYELEYWYSLTNGGPAILAPNEVLHLKNLSIDGIRGLSPIAHQREAVGLTMALESFAGHFFGNDSTPGGFLSSPNKLSDPARERLKKGWEAGHRGLDNSHRMAVLEEGITFQKVGIPPEDAQFIQSRQYQLTEIARMYRVPLHLIGEMGRVTHANIEHMGIDYVTHTIRPICVNWEQSMALKLFRPSERGTYFAEFNVDALLRGDLASRYAAYAQGRQWGFLNVDEIRDKENLNPLPDDLGQEYLSPLNMVAAGTAPVPAADAPVPGGEDAPDDAGSRSLDWQRWFKRELEQIVRVERERVLQNAQKLLKSGDSRAFGRWLIEFYGEKHPIWMQERLLVLFEGDSRVFGQSYVGDFAVRHCQSQLKAIQDLMASRNGEFREALEAEIATWETSRPLQVVQNERFRLQLAPELREAPPTTVINNYVTPAIIPAPLVTVPVNNEVRVEAPSAPNVTVENTVQPAAAPHVTVEAAQVRVENTFEAPPAPNVTIDAPITVTTPEVPVNVTVEGAVITPHIQAPDVTILPTENVINVNIPAPEPSRGVQVLYDGAGKVIGTAPRSAPKPEDPKKLKGKK